MGIAPTMSRTIVRFTREGLEGKVTGYKEVTIPAHSITAKNSTSLLRKPGTKSEFVRGKAGFFPFTPGGLDAGSAYERAEDLERTEAIMESRIGADGLLQVAPGFKRGLVLPIAEDGELPEQTEEFKFGDVKPIRKARANPSHNTLLKKQDDATLSELDSIDDLLPIEVRIILIFKSSRSIADGV